jgi:AcrR family transcriptional regulator
MKELTPDRLLDAAEVVFGEQGYAGMSIRAVAQLSECNVAAVNYHFGSKQNLVTEMLRRRIRPLNRKRLEWLRKARADYGAELIPLEEIIRILIQPLAEAILHADSVDRRFMAIISRSLTDPSPFIQKVHGQFFDELKKEFSMEINRHFPDIDAEEAQVRMVVMTASMLGTITHLPAVVERIWNHKEKFPYGKVIDFLVPFLSSGIRAS